MRELETFPPKLPEHDFRRVIESAPLVSIDLVVICARRVLLGLRLNRPAQGFWFVPGGRIRKSETLSDAYQRLTKTELGVTLNYSTAVSLGVYEHFYNDSVFGESPSTHYIALGMRLELREQPLVLPKDQHGSFEWWDIDQAISSPDVHQYTKDYLQSFPIYDE